MAQDISQLERKIKELKDEYEKEESNYWEIQNNIEEKLLNIGHEIKKAEDELHQINANQETGSSTILSSETGNN